MTDDEVRRYDGGVRIKEFADSNASFFPAGSVQETQVTVITDELTAIDILGGKQAGGFAESRQQYEVKDTARENMRDDMSDWSRTAKSMEYEFNGIMDKFRMPRGSRDADLINTARAFVTEAAPYQADFIRYGMPATFIADLQAKIAAFEATLGPTADAVTEHVEATAEIAAAIRRIMVARRILDGVMRNVLAANTGKLAAWVSASHIEKAPQRTPPPTP